MKVKKSIREKKRKKGGRGKKRGERRRKSQGRNEPKSLRFAGAFPFEHAGGFGNNHRSHFVFYC